MSQIYGELPVGKVIFAACDSNYFIEHALPFALSSSKAGFDTHIHVTSPTLEVFSHAGIINSVTENRVTYTFDDADLSKFTDEEKRTYYACLRFHILPFIIPSAGRVLTLDIDCMVMKNFQFPAMQPCGYFPRPNESHPGMKVAAGAVYLTKGSLNVAQAISDTLNNMSLQWFADQIALSHVFKQIPEEHVAKFDNKFMDWEFIDGTAIWTGKGPRKYDNPKYLKKKAEYNDEASIKVTSAKTVLLKPRLDIPFKKFGLEKENKGGLPEIRTHWQNFANKIDADLVVELPRWMFNSTIEKMISAESALLVPHTEKPYWSGPKKNNTRFYMQTVFPWLFTIDELGWGGGAKFLDTFDPNKMYSDGAFNKMREYALSGKSKFSQPSKGDPVEINSPTIFVPLQLPHDETIKYHADITVPEFVEALCKWADESDDRPNILFKGHPVNLTSMEPLRRIIERYKRVIYRTDLNIHEIIPKVDAVYVINSGTGQEAMLHDKPVVAFGDCEYQGAVIKGNIFDLNQTWNSVESDDKDARLHLYRKWYHWYINTITFDTTT
jgi:hypothetical protein